MRPFVFSISQKVFSMQQITPKNVLVAVGLFATGLLSLLQISSWFSEPRVDLEMRVMASDHYESPRVAAADKEREELIGSFAGGKILEAGDVDFARDLYFSDLQVFSEEDKAAIERLRKRKQLSQRELWLVDRIIAHDEDASISVEKGISELAERAGRNVQSRFSDIRHRSSDIRLDPVNGVVNAVIVNRGDRQAAAVRLVVPNATMAVLKREDRSEVIAETAGRLELGVIQPGETVSCILWTKYFTGAHSLEEIQLTHSDGIGDIQILEPLGDPWRWLANNWGGLLFFFALNGVLVLTLYAAAADQKRRNNRAFEQKALEKEGGSHGQQPD